MPCIKKKLFLISFVGLSSMGLFSNRHACAMDIGRDVEENLLIKAVAIERSFLAQADEAIQAGDITMLKNAALDTIPFFEVVKQMPPYLKYAYGQHRKDVYVKVSQVHAKEAELYENQQNLCGAGYQYDLAALALEYAVSLYIEEGQDQEKVAPYYGKISGDTLSEYVRKYGLIDSGYWSLEKYAQDNIVNALINYGEAIERGQSSKSLAQNHLNLLKKRGVLIKRET